jgi:hypothetical protein
VAFIAVSHHVRNRSQADVIARLSENRIEGFVFPRSLAGWVTVVTDKDLPTTGNDEVKGLEQETVLHYWYAKDLYWGFGLAFGGRSLMKHTCDWSQRPNIAVSSSVDSRMLARICRADLSQQNLLELDRLLGLGTTEAVMEYEPYLKIPKMLGLDHYENISFALLERDPERSMNQHKGLRWVAVQE